jgi:glycosyltransferase involved in cell wall biosynthesis
MPLLDAMAREVPVLTSNVSAMPEVAGDAALLVDPTNVAAIGDGLKTLVDDEALRQQLVHKGLKRSSEFAWETAVEQTWELYAELFR